MPQYKSYKDWKGLHIKTRGIGFKRILGFILPFYTGKPVSFNLHIRRKEKIAPDLSKIHIKEKLPNQKRFKDIKTLKTYKGKGNAKILITTSELTEQGDLTCKLVYADINANPHEVNLLTANIFSKDKIIIHFVVSIMVSIILLIFGGFLISGVNPQTIIGRLIDKFEGQPKTQYNEKPYSEFHEIEDLPICNFDIQKFPCKYWTKDDEFAKDIANAAYKNRTNLVERIMELYRDKENGGIPVFKSNLHIIIPEPGGERNSKYYEFYFQLLTTPITQCTNIDSPQTPCWYISEGESYEELATHYSTTINDLCIREANKTEWDGLQLVPKTIEQGTMIMLPVCPSRN